jgi:hypothetical protein
MHCLNGVVRSPCTNPMRRKGAKMRTAQAREHDDGPAKIAQGQVFVIETIAKGAGKGEAKRYRAVYPSHPLRRALKAEKISEDEFAAGEFYRRLYEKLARSGRDSLDFALVSGGQGLPWSQTQDDAFRLLMAVESRLPQGGIRWAVVIRAFCGEAHNARTACIRAGVKNPRFVWITIRLALSKLSAAIVGTKLP